MKTIKELIFKANFRHVFAMSLLISFMMLVGVPFWVSTKDLKENSHAWAYLSSSIGVIGTLLTLAGRRYFDEKSLNKNETIEKGENQMGTLPPVNISGDTPIGTVGTCPTCGMQPQNIH